MVKCQQNANLQTCAIICKNYCANACKFAKHTDVKQRNKAHTVQKLHKTHLTQSEE
ncbi:hypothetical protein HMPREF1584_01482 [Gardnerella vaginalis JCP8481A]|nr:hypothetical protein HMPREF1584_01482 [Gardnerella vaginalis JCP8481A]